MKRFFLLLALVSCLLAPGLAQADNLARDYIPAPPGTLATMLYYAYATADDLYRDGDNINSNIDLSVNLGLLRVVYWTEIGPFVVDPQFILPFGRKSLDLNTTLPNDNWSSSGIGDLELLATVWLLNDPDSKMWLGVTPFIFIPTGEYDEEKQVNMGDNIWQFRLESDFVKGFEVLPGHNIYFQFLLGAQFFTENDSTDTKRDPEFTFEHHTSYDITEKLWASADYYYHWAGEREIDDVDQNDSQNSHTLGMTLGWNFLPDYQLAVQYKNDLYVEEGPRTQTFMLRFMYVTDFESLVGSKKK